jgi:hypothetical protein
VLAMAMLGWQGVFGSDKAAFRVVPRGMTNGRHDFIAAFCSNNASWLTGSLACPRGCGTIILWALCEDVAEYKEQFLTYLYQQLSWTACPDHTAIERQRREVGFDPDLIILPSPSSVMAGEVRYRNRYE